MSSNQGGSGDGPPTTKSRPIFANIIPENRHYAVFIINNDPAAATDSVLIMDHIFNKIGCSTLPHRLRFNQCVPKAEFSGNLMIGCEDEDTAKWLICAIRELRPHHSAVTFIHFFGLVPCSVVLAVTENPRESTSSIFKILEKENNEIQTDKWVVVGRADLGFMRRVSGSCPK